MHRDTLVEETGRESRSCGVSYRTHTLGMNTPSIGDYHAPIMHYTLSDWSGTQSESKNHMHTSPH